MPADTDVSAARTGRPPIFIVGSPRSGTSLLRLVVDSHSQIACGPETHFLAELDDSGRRHRERIGLHGWDERRWNDACRTMFAGLKEEYAASKAKPRWADKTPGYATHLPFVTALWPDAQIVHVIRDARLVTASALDRWGWRRAWDLPDQWVEHVRAAQQAGATLGTDRYREVRFEQLVTEPEATLRALVEWLGERWEPELLDYDQFGHDERAGRNRTISDASRAETGGAVDPRRAQSPRARLDPLLRMRVDRVAGSLNRELGYR